jgi:predicted N-acyltransferase
VDENALEQSYQWLRAVEDARIRDMYYIFLKKKKKLKAAVCCFPQIEEMFKISMPLLEIRCPLGSSCGFFSSTSEETELLLKGTESIQHQINTKGLLILDLTQKEHDRLYPRLDGFSSIRLNDNTFIDLEFSDFDEYLHSLPAKARKSVRLTLNRSRRRNITVLYTSEFSKWKQVAQRLQGYICEKHHNFRWYLSLAFYDALETHLKEHAGLLMFFKEDNPLAFALSLNTSQTVQYKFVGVDPRYRKYEAYFLVYYEGIRRALQKNQKRIYFGPSTYKFKEKIGCMREPLYGLVKARNPCLNAALRWMMKGYSLMGKRL